MKKIAAIDEKWKNIAQAPKMARTGIHFPESSKSE